VPARFLPHTFGLPRFLRLLVLACVLACLRLRLRLKLRLSPLPKRFASTKQMLRRPASPAFSLRDSSRSSLLCIAGIGAALGFAPACGNISLTNAADFASAGSAAANPAHGPDASADASIETPPVGLVDAEPPPAAADAAAVSTASGSPLCFFDELGDGGAHICAPDTSNQCAPVGVDSGAYYPWDDAGLGMDGGAVAVALSACHVTTSGQTCTGAGLGGDGAQCQSGADCASTFECVGSPGQCRHYCCGGNATCDGASGVTTGATFCDVQPLTVGGQPVPVCEPIANCTPLLTGTGAGTCPKGETCAVVKDDGTTSCVTIGSAGIGGDCGKLHCAAELTCLGPPESRTCFELCQVDLPTSCPNGKTCMSSAQLFTNANIGICQ
jgi:hypothetical protein